MAAAESSESSEDETLPVAQLRIVRPAGRGATDLTLPLCARVALVKVKLEHELGVPEADQRLIYGGKVLTDAQTLEDIVGTKEGRQTFHLVVPPPPPAPAPPPVDLDASPEAQAPAPATPPRPTAVAPQATPPRQQPSTPITVSPAARAYAEALRNSGFGASPRDATRQFVEDARAALAAAQPPTQQQPEAQPHLWDHIRDNEFLDWTLMLKLLAGVALLGQDASRGRVAGLIGAATAAYAVQTGLAYALWELFSSSRPQRRRSSQGYRVRSAGEIIRASFDGTIHGPRDGGRLADFGLLVASLVLSLAPPWRPRDRADVLLLRVRDSLSNQIVWFKVKTTTKFGKVYRAFAARQAGDGPQRAWIFSKPGSTDVISEDATPLDLGLTPESILEARPAGPAPAAEPAAAPAEPAAAAVPPAEPVAATE